MALSFTLLCLYRTERRVQNKNIVRGVLENGCTCSYFCSRSKVSRRTEPRQLYSRADLHGGWRLPAYPRIVMVWPQPFWESFLTLLLQLSWWEILLEHASSASTAPKKEVTTRAVSLGLAQSWLA